jgi:hypothetical protein
MTPLRSTMTDLRSLRDLADASPGAAADATRSMFKQPPQLTSEQKAAIAADLAHIEAFRTGQLITAPELPKTREEAADVLAKFDANPNPTDAEKAFAITCSAIVARGR